MMAVEEDSVAANWDFYGILLGCDLCRIDKEKKIKNSLETELKKQSRSGDASGKKFQLRTLQMEFSSPHGGVVA